MSHITEGFGRCAYVSETKAAEIRQKNQKLVNEQKAKRYEIRKQISNYRQAKSLGLTVEEYINLTGRGEK